MKPADHSDNRLLPLHLSSHWYNDRAFVPNDPWHSFSPERTALIMVDLINWQIDPDGVSMRALRAAGRGIGADYLVQRSAEVILPNLSVAVPAARRANIRIVHARLASRHSEYQDVVPALRPYVQAAKAKDGSWETSPIAAVGNHPEDLSIVKSGSGAFGGTDLDFLLRREGIDTLIYAGVITTACVLLSVCAGFDLGYRQYLLSDATGTLSDRDQGDAERFIGSYLAEVVNTHDLLSILSSRPECGELT